MPGAEMCSEEKQSSEEDRDPWGWGWALMCMEHSGKASLKRWHWNRDLEEVRNGGSQEKSIPDKHKGKVPKLVISSLCRRKNKSPVCLECMIHVWQEVGEVGRACPGKHSRRNLDFVRSVKRSHWKVGATADMRSCSQRSSGCAGDRLQAGRRLWGVPFQKLL